MEDTRARWERAFLEALDFDTWGQVEEAIEGYQRLQVAAAAEYVENVLQLPVHRRDGIGKLAAALKFRVTELQSGTERGVGLAGMKAVKPYMQEMIITDVEFPLPGIKAEAMVGPTGPGHEPGEEETYEVEEDEIPEHGDGTLRGPPANAKHGENVLVIFVDKWCFKDATPFHEPRVVISVRDDKGNVLEAVQETPIAKCSTQSEVYFEQTVFVQTPLERLPGTAAIFFEFKHFKVKKQKKSTKCYCFIEMDEVRDGPVTLEVYKKPANYTRKGNPSLLTIKPLYLHIDMQVQSVV